MADEFICDTAEVRSFIDKVKEIVAGTASVEERLVAIRPLFSQVMADPSWLPKAFRRFGLEAVAQDVANIVAQQVQGDGGLVTSGDDSVNVTSRRD